MARAELPGSYAWHGRDQPSNLMNYIGDVVIASIIEDSSKSHFISSELCPVSRDIAGESLPTRKVVPESLNVLILRTNLGPTVGV